MTVAATRGSDDLAMISVRGICLDDARKPISQVEVRLYAMRFCTENLDLLRSSRTGQDGRFDLGEFPKPGLPGVHVGVVGIPGLPKGPIAYRVVQIKEGKAVQIIPIPGHRPEMIDAVMTSGAKLDGTVVGPGKRPVVGAAVWVAGFGGMADVGVATTDESGRFTIPDMTPWQPNFIANRLKSLPLAPGKAYRAAALSQAAISLGRGMKEEHPLWHQGPRAITRLASPESP